MEDLEATSEDEGSVDSQMATEILEMRLEGNELCYLCATSENKYVLIDRSDLMDGSEQQKLVLKFERKWPPPWDLICTYCENDGCEECICDECERPMRHINGVNYGCEKHPVV